MYSSCPNVLKIKHHLPLYTDNRGNNAAHHLAEDISIFGCNLYHILLTFIPYFYISAETVRYSVSFPLYAICITHTKNFSFTKNHVWS